MEVTRLKEEKIFLQCAERNRFQIEWGEVVFSIRILVRHKKLC